MCIYIVKKQKKKIPQAGGGGGGCAAPPNVPKLGLSGVKDTAKLTKVEACHVAYR